MSNITFSVVPNWIDGELSDPLGDRWMDKLNPHDSSFISKVARSSDQDVFVAVKAANNAFNAWASLTAIQRGKFLGEIVRLMRERYKLIAGCVALETGKRLADAEGETNGAILQGEYWLSEGMRMYGHSLTSAIPNKTVFTVRKPVGVAALIVPANTPIANIAWKLFPALLCGNTVVMKAAEDAPNIARLIAEISRDAGLPPGVFNVINGEGAEAGKSLVLMDGVSLVSFTGSTAAGRWIAENAGRKLLKVSLELGGKNPFIVCDDADIERAVNWASLSAFSNAGQRCSSGSRIIVFKNIYDEFKEKLLAKVNSLTLGTHSDSDLGPLINRPQWRRVLSAINEAKEEGGDVICGGLAPDCKNLEKGCYILPTIIEGLNMRSKFCSTEIFGPVASLHATSDLFEALALAEETEYGLTAAIHTKSIDRGMWFAQRVKTGVVNINTGTFGSEPHMPFGGIGISGNGTREPGFEALNVYTELQNISVLARKELI